MFRVLLLPGGNRSYGDMCDGPAGFDRDDHGLIGSFPMVTKKRSRKSSRKSRASRRSAPRARRGNAPSAMQKRFTVERIRLNSGGYDHGGRYYGTGAPLFSVHDSETDKTSEVRASCASAARQKVMQEIDGPPPVNALHGETRKLSKALYQAVVNDDRPSQTTVDRFRSEVNELASAVRALTPDDVTWKYYSRELDKVPEGGRYALSGLHTLSQMIAGAASRMKS